MRLVCLFLIALVTAANAKHYHLFVLTGQSNSLGSSGCVWTGLQAYQGRCYPGNATHWGPEIDFFRSLYRAGVRDFGIIKVSRGGGGNTNWSKSSGGHMYEHVKQTVDVATEALTAAGDTFEIVGFLYVQGGRDSSGEASIADTRLDELISNLRADLPNASSMHAVVGGIAAAGGNRDTVRIKQAELAAGDLAIDYFENLDLQGQLYDSLHFDRAAKLMVGKRFAKAFFEAGVVAPDYGKLVFVGDSVTQGGLGF
ncbi:sialate O-acetylesterase [Akkermansiaceae bacterium]|nr:sialate O-acetylesterase [bacterium]MDB4566583.1 sialate O-acetylesterase [Akkermansiaceae bacterium]MDB4572458.1 sialate O-acetylesterase [Akkermansiaceae bacterium]